MLVYAMELTRDVGERTALAQCCMQSMNLKTRPRSPSGMSSLGAVKLGSEDKQGRPFLEEEFGAIPVPEEWHSLWSSFTGLKIFKLPQCRLPWYYSPCRASMFEHRPVVPS